MKTSVIGFPRIGAHRELKFVTESYFRGEKSTEELLEDVREQRQGQWILQEKAGIDFVPSNDFSLYDGVLDTAFLLNAIPQRYQDLGLGDVDTYFAMARGYQGTAGDVKAFSMKKWFNTNYHYMVPEIEDTVDIKLRSSAFLDGYRQAKELGIETKPVLVGPFTFLKLADFVGKKTVADVLPAILAAYEDILKWLRTKVLLGYNWMSLI